MRVIEINVDFGKKCPKCGKPGAVNGGPCFKCLEKKLRDGLRVTRKGRGRR